MFITPRIKEICSMTFEKGLFRIEAGTFHLASDCSNNLNFSPHTWEIQLDRKTVSDIIVRLQTCNVFTIVKHETSVFQDQRRKSWTEKSFYDLIPLRLRVNIIYSWQRKWLNWWNTVLFLLRNNSYEFEKKGIRELLWKMAEKMSLRARVRMITPSSCWSGGCLLMALRNLKLKIWRKWAIAADRCVACFLDVWVQSQKNANFLHLVRRMLDHEAPPTLSPTIVTSWFSGNNHVWNSAWS